MTLTLRLMTSLSLLLACTALAAGDPDAGRQKAAVCAACHGIDGNSVVAQWPKLAGQHPEYLERQIKLIRDGARPVPEMAPIVAGLSDEDVADLAAYFSAQTRSPGVADETLVAAGQRLFRAGDDKSGVPACMACHGPAGEGNPLAGYPSLAGQHATYTAKMLTGFREGITWGDDDASSQVMTGVAKYLTPPEIKAVASYIEGLYEASSE